MQSKRPFLLRIRKALLLTILSPFSSPATNVACCWPAPVVLADPNSPDSSGLDASVASERSSTLDVAIYPRLVRKLVWSLVVHRW
jgi:hypothetical protein